ncbi:SGNH/GDSL hydrolase family protein [Paenibacillus sp. R14(2021)]|uniref:SGNH/GDSL hydrolase family protein n=1 Tax=Paenibacillus sp. R14(2021) TaxID=2859228 RepID=UPI001C614A53|nr:SGNH/GDSL hydrolase family protein [Paenibacillus sp. R14(2021)]
MFQPNTTILFQGDSITDGNRGRDSDPNHIFGHGYVHLIASRLGADYPARNLTFINKGISGNRAVDLYARWQEDALNLKPDVLSILVGVNDILKAFDDASGAPAPKFERVYSLLLEEAREANPALSLVLCEPFVLPVGRVGEQWERWREEIGLRQEAIKRIASAFGAVHVPLQQLFDDAAQTAAAAYWLWDGFHPTAAGHELIARQWLRTVEAALPSARR